MCILFIAVKQHPDYPVIICANRDEFHQRPTQNMHCWPDEKIIAGKDLQAGGTWLGINTDGDFAALTNFRRPAHIDKSKRTRGDLVVQALNTNKDKIRSNAANHKNIQQYLTQESYRYNDFNLVFGPLNNLQVFDSVNKKLTVLDSGFHSICNGALDDIWPKMTLGINTLHNIVNTNNINIEQLFDVMMNQEVAKKQHLPETGIPQEWESLLSSIFIVSPEYGTRSTTIILQSTSGDVTIYERSYNNDGKLDNNQYRRFTIQIK